MLEWQFVRAKFLFLALFQSRIQSLRECSEIQAAHTAPHVSRPSVRLGQKGKFVPTTMREARLDAETGILREPAARQKESYMKISGGWRGGKPSKKRVRPSYKPKIRWELLGLSNPNIEETSTPIETIRREVSSLASRGFGQGTRSRSGTSDGNGSGRIHRVNPSRPRRRGATE